MIRALLAGATATAEVAAELAAGGVDAVIAYHSSDFRRRGLPSVAGLLPWVNANDQTAGLLPGVVRGAGSTPVLATVCANDGTRDPGRVLDTVVGLGALGVLNAPTVGLFTGPVRDALEDACLGASAELDLIRRAARAGLNAWCYVFDADWTRRAIDAGATALVIHLGITGSHGPDPAGVLADCLDAAAGSEVPVLVHGGPLRAPEDLATVGATGPGLGFFGASALEYPPDGLSPRAATTRWRTALDDMEQEAWRLTP